jgi:probable F420-dependent oxidoreductase
LEAAGFGAAWVTETVRDPYLRLAGAATETDHLRLGTGVAIAFARSPMTTAQSAHDLQRLSGGRLLLGLGSQVRAHVTRRFSMPWGSAARRMREYVLALRAIWASWNDATALDFAGEFYTHTLMTPFFDPGPTGYGPPPVLLGGVGAQMTAVAGEVADGFICGPLTSELSFREITLPALQAGQARRAEPEAPFTVCAMPLIVTGADAEQTRLVAEATRARIAFYASTPAYRSVLERHGWAALHDRLHDLSRTGQWAQMTAVVDDEVLHAFAIVAAPDDVAAAVAARYGSMVGRAIVHSALDPGLDVWQSVLSSAAEQAR